MGIKRDLIASYVSSIWAGAMSLLFVPLYVRYLGVESYGLVGVFLAIQAWLALLDLGMSPALCREMSRHVAGEVPARETRELVNTAATLFTAMAVAILVAVYAAAPAIASKWLNPQALSAQTVVAALRIAGLVIALRWVAAMYRSVLQGLHKITWLAFATTVISTLRAAGAVLVIALVENSLAAFFWFLALAALVETLVLALCVDRVLPRRITQLLFSFPALERIWKFATGMFLIALLSTVLMQIDKIILSNVLTLEAFGQFTLATTIAGVLGLLVGPVVTVAFPRLTALTAARADPRSMAGTYHKFAGLLTLCVAPPTIMLFAFTAEILTAWSGGALSVPEIAPVLRIWVLGSALNCFMQMPYLAQLAHGQTRLTVYVNIVMVLLVTPCYALLVPRYGAIAAAWTWLAINICYVIIVVGLVHRRILAGEAGTWYFKDWMVPTLAGGSVAVVMKGLLVALGHLDRVTLLAYLVAAGGLVTIAVAVANRDIRLAARETAALWQSPSTVR